MTVSLSISYDCLFGTFFVEKVNNVDRLEKRDENGPVLYIKAVTVLHDVN